MSGSHLKAKNTPKGGQLQTCSQNQESGALLALHPAPSLTALFVVLLTEREDELLLGFATSRPVLKS